MASAQLSTNDPFYCFATDPLRPQLGMFRTATQYDNIRGNAFNTPISTCTPARTWVLSRGGSRLPDATQINTMRGFYQTLRSRVTRGIELGRASLCRPDADNINRWVFNDTITTDRALELTQTGFDELRNLATRLQIAFPSILPRTYNQAQFRFRHTYRERTADSALAFASGLFGHTDVVLDDIPNQDRLLRPVDTCRLYDQFADNNGERNAFREGIDFELMAEQVNRKLGLVGSNQLSTSELLTVADFCRFEQSIDPSVPSPWCAAFSIANINVLQYSSDLG
jgi:multiple inositol-polyphosphate phosphatase/2,3-bisphosphoglycerate 3-phosphatase